MEQKEEVVFLSSPSFPLAGKKGIKLAELLHEPFFLTEKNANYRRAFDRYPATKNIPVSYTHLDVYKRQLSFLRSVKYIECLTHEAHHELQHFQHIRKCPSVDSTDLNQKKRQNHGQEAHRNVSKEDPALADVYKRQM